MLSIRRCRGESRRLWNPDPECQFRRAIRNATGGESIEEWLRSVKILSPVAEERSAMAPENARGCMKQLFSHSVT